MPIKTDRQVDPGICGEIGATVHSFLEFFQVRAQLVALEAREGIQALKIHATVLSLGILFLLLGYVCGITAGVSLLSKKLAVEWEMMLLWVMLPHLLIGAGLVRMAFDHLFKPLFDSTLEELEKDQLWLQKNLKSNGRRLN